TLTARGRELQSSRYVYTNLKNALGIGLNQKAMLSAAEATLPLRLNLSNEAVALLRLRSA
ncbi:hypothetical protein ACFP2F_21180, partial [Hymenobacter artigasi]|uniref:hypothetical protein n=1 Tax=Hymenobacter artigasi TaxID=2719616 RepID=UPI003622C637